MRLIYRLVAKRKILPFLLALSITTALAGDGPWRPHIGPEGQGGNFKRGGGGDAWFPFCQTDSSLFFVQGGGGWFRNAATGSLGLGYRQLRPDGRWALGVNGFVDVAHPDFNRGTFGQVGAGVELFQCHWLARGNLYVPFTKSKRTNVAFETRIVMDGVSTVEERIQRDTRERAFPGVDGEVGYEQALGCGQLGLYGGYFYYKKSNFPPIHGPRARLEYRIDQGRPWPNSRGELILGAEYERDRIHGQTALIRAGWRFSLGCKKRSCCCVTPLMRYMGRRVWREKTLWVDETIGESVVERVVVGNIIFANNTNNGIGTQTDPALLPEALSMLSPTNVLFLLQDTGNITTTSTINTPDGVQILGFGDEVARLVTIPIFGSFVVTDLTGAGRATLVGTGLDPVIEAVDDNFICGIAILNGATGVRQQGIGAVRIEDVIFTNPTATAILNDGGGSLTVDRAQITTAGIGIRTFNALDDVIITGTLAANTQITAATGICIDSPAAGMTRIFNTTINSSVDGIVLTDDLDTRIDGVGISATMIGVGITTSALPPITRDVRLLNSSVAGGTFGVAGTLLGSGVLVIDGNNLVGVLSGAALSFTNPSWQVRVSNNPDIRETGVGVPLSLTVSAGTFTAEVSSNTLTSLASLGSGLTVTVMNNSTTNVSILNNFAANAMAVVPGYRVAVTSFATSSCATLIGNDRLLSGGADIDLSGVGNLLDVWNLAVLGVTNNGLTTLTAGVAQAAGPCPLPVIPP